MNKNKEKWVDKHHANKKLSIYTSMLTFAIGACYVIVNFIIQDRIPTQEEAIAVMIILLGLNAVSVGSDLRGFLKILKGQDNSKNGGISGSNTDSTENGSK